MTALRFPPTCHPEHSEGSSKGLFKSAKAREGQSIVGAPLRRPPGSTMRFVQGGRWGGLSTATPPLHRYNTKPFANANRERFFAAAQNDRRLARDVILSGAKDLARGCFKAQKHVKSSRNYSYRMIGKTGLPRPFRPRNDVVRMRFVVRHCEEHLQRCDVAIRFSSVQDHAIYHATLPHPIAPYFTTPFCRMMLA